MSTTVKNTWKETEIGKTPFNWEVKSIDEIKSKEPKSIISGPFGSNISSKFFVPDGIPVIRGNNLSLEVGKKFIDEGFVFITEEKANELGTWALKDDLIFTAAGTIGQVGILSGNEKYSTYIISNKQLRVRLDKSIVEPLFAYYWFASPQMANTINQRDTGSTIPLINLTVLKGLEILLPPLPEQRAIAGVLSSLDDKIDLLHRQNKTLEGMAEALWRKMFVEEADPGWKTYALSDLATHEKRSINPIKNPETLFYHYSVPAFDETHMPVPELGISIRSNKYKVMKSTILFSKLNPDKDKRIWLIPNSIPENSICSTEFQIIKPKNEKYLFFLYGFVSSPENYNEIAAGVGGTSSSHQRIDPDVIFKLSCFIPDDNTLTSYNRIVEPISSRIDHNRVSIKTLSHLRDNLLPKLMSGEVRVKV